MKLLLTLAFCLVGTVGCFAQTQPEVKRKFSDTEQAIAHYRELVQQAWATNNEALAKSYEDSVTHSIIGSYLDGHTFTTINNRKVSLQNLDKPVLLMASATWCPGCMGEVPALNKIAETYADKVYFVVLFQDTRGDKLTKAYKQFSKLISVVPSDIKLDSPHSIDISGFRHTTGYPTNYLVAKNRQIIGYSQGAAAPTTYQTPDGKTVTITKERAFEVNYANLKAEVEKLLQASN